MTSEMITRAERTAQFGSFVLHPLMRRLEKDGVCVSLGGRALDILIALMDRAGEIVTHQELQDKVWQKVVVEPSSLRVQMRALRKALGDGGDGGQYIVNISGRGYCFVAPVMRTLTEPPDVPVDAEFNLPKLTPLIGRDQAVRNVVARLVETRFVTITGTGGVGKTALAVAAAHALERAFEGAVLFLDLGEVASPHAAHVMLGRAALRRLVIADGAVKGIAQFLQSKRMLIVLDCCDGVAAAMAELAVTLVQEAREVHVLATSRKRLDGAGETVIVLPPLACPEDADTMPLEALTKYAGVQLLSDLVRRHNRETRLGDVELRALARMTKQLDGLPLALMLAGASILQNGITQTASMIKSRFALFMTNPDAVVPRHASLGTTLEWSYAQLAAEERCVFRNLAIFSGSFTIDGILKVAPEADMDEQTVTAAAMTLLAKSVMFREATAEEPRYRMLDTTRAFGMSKLLTLGGGESVRRRHALYITQCLERTNAPAQGHSVARLPETLTCNIHNIRAALEWCFSPYGDTRLGARLSVASAQVFNALFLHAEALSWLKQALCKLDEQSIGTQLELDIRFGMLLNSVEPPDIDTVPLQLPIIVALADKVGSRIVRAEARAWNITLMAQARPLDETIKCARTLREITLLSDDYPTRLLGDWLLGLAYHLRGTLDKVGPLCASAASLEFPSKSIYFSGAQSAAQIGAIGALARTLWLQGRPEAALRVARNAVTRLGDGDMSDYQSARVFFVPLFIWSGAFQDAEDLLGNVHEESAREIDSAFAQMYLGALFLRRGEIDQAVLTLQDAHARLTTNAQRGIVATDLAEALALQGQFAPARRAIEWAFDAGEQSGESFFFPELYRVMGVVMTLAPSSAAPDPEAWFLRAIDCANRHGSLSFALRAATSLARFCDGRGSASRAQAMLADIYGRFTEGLDTHDLVAARDLIRTFSKAAAAPAGLAVAS